MEEMSFVTTNDKGLEVKCDVLSVINDDEDNTYLLYTDYTLNDQDEYNVYVSQMIEKGDKTYELESVVNTDIIPGLQEVYDDVKKQLKLQNS